MLYLDLCVPLRVFAQAEAKRCGAGIVGILQKFGLKGKAIGDALSAIKLAVIDGEITNLEEEVNFVKSKILQQQ